jgi:hypothetical protein
MAVTICFCRTCSFMWATASRDDLGDELLWLGCRCRGCAGSWRIRGVRGRIGGRLSLRGGRRFGCRLRCARRLPWRVPRRAARGRRWRPAPRRSRSYGGAGAGPDRLRTPPRWASRSLAPPSRCAQIATAENGACRALPDAAVLDRSAGSLMSLDARSVQPHPSVPRRTIQRRRRHTGLLLTGTPSVTMTLLRGSPGRPCHGS